MMLTAIPFVINKQINKYKIYCAGQWNLEGMYEFFNRRR